MSEDMIDALEDFIIERKRLNIDHASNSVRSADYNQYIAKHLAFVEMHNFLVILRRKHRDFVEELEAEE